jgi:hypothetical protein
MRTNTSPRKQIIKYAKKIRRPINNKLIVSADNYVDEALNTLELEEPELLSYLSSRKMSVPLDATVAAMYGAIVDDARNGMPIEHTIPIIDSLLYRLVCAVGLDVSMQYREPIKMDSGEQDG